MKVEVINTGTELLLGSVINTHLKHLAEALFPLGLRVQRQVTVPDGAAIQEALRESFGRADIVIVTGGLGPTIDDITRELVAELYGLELVHDPAIMELIHSRFARHGLLMTDRVQRQAQRPQEATVLHNDHGTAPGLYFAPQQIPGGLEGKLTPHLFLLPGPPRELHPMVQDSVLPIIQKLLPTALVSEMRVFRVAGIGESGVEDLVGADLQTLDLELGYCARPGEVEIRLIGHPGELAAAEALLLRKLGSHIVSQDGQSLEAAVIALLGTRGESLAVAESCTGGFLAHRLTNVPGASVVFIASYVTYADEAKIKTLGVDAALIARHGAVSHEVAIAMARGALQTSGADHALATTGIAGPGGGTEVKPVGTVYIALATRSGTPRVGRHRFATDRETFKFLATQSALDLLRRNLLEPTPDTPRLKSIQAPS